ncbi:MAG: TetR/AcrR family transcriptional regulator [Deltaproteobacteria bacterium]|nr:TetR/AcrR family transcriptional regulator [Deltaproteobacteria bacterium]
MPVAKKRAYHHGDLARALVDAALQHIGREGVEAFTLREAARVAGVTHAAAYRHFADKRALLATIAEDGFRTLSDDLRDAAHSEGDALEKLTSIGRAYVRFAFREPARFRVMFGPRLNYDRRFPSLEAETQRAFRILLDAIEAGQRDGELIEGVSRDLATALWTSAHGFASLVLHRKIIVRSATRAEAYYVEIVRPLLTGLRR